MPRRALLIALCLLTFGCGSSQPKATTSAGAHRIVCLIPAVTEMLFAMGAGDDVVGVSSYDHFPAEVETRTRVGALLDPDFERILSLRPDLVIVYGSQSDLIDRLSRASLPIYNYSHAGLADITETIRSLGERIGRAEAAVRLASQIENDLDATRKRVAGLPRPTTTLVFGREPNGIRGVFVSGGIGFLHDMLDAAGGEDAFGDVKKQSLQASAEMLIGREPQVILEVHPAADWSPERLEREKAVWKELPSLPAVRTNRVYLLADDRLLTPGPRVAEGVRIIADVLHPK